MRTSGVKGVGTLAMLALLLLASPPVQARVTLAPDANGYQLIDSVELYGPNFDYVDISQTGENLKLGDDDSVERRPGFEMIFYGQKYYTLFISANGYVSFVPSSGGLNDGGNKGPPVAIPALGTAVGGQAPPFIAPWFDDLDPEKGGAVYYEVRGTAPNRRIIVQWRAVHHDDTSANPTMFDFEMIMREGTNEILFQYNTTVSPDTALTQGNSATAGIQGSATAGINYWVGDPSKVLAATDGLTEKLAVGFIPKKYGYVGIPESSQGQTMSAAPGSVVSYQVTVVNGKDTTTDYNVQWLYGVRWTVEVLVDGNVLPNDGVITLAPGETKVLTVNVTVPAAGSASMEDDIVSFRVYDKSTIDTSSSSSGGNNSNTSSSNTNTQNNVVSDSSSTTAKQTSPILSLFNLTTQCQPAPCYPQDSDDDGVVDTAESTPDDATKIDGFTLISGASINMDVEIYVRAGDENKSQRGLFHGFRNEEAGTPPDGMEFASGLFNYRVLTAIGGAVYLKLTPNSSWPDGYTLYHVASDGSYAEIDEKKETKRWTILDNSNTLQIPLVDGGDLDEDGEPNGVVVSRLLIGTKAVATTSGRSFGSGGALYPELLLLALLLGWRYGRRIRR